MKWKQNLTGIRVKNGSATTIKQFKIQKSINQESKYWYCDNCKKKYNYTYFGIIADHILPVFAGGETTIENLQILCEKCNKEKTAIDHKIWSIFKQLNILEKILNEYIFYLSKDIISQLYFTLFLLYEISTREMEKDLDLTQKTLMTPYSKV